MYRVVQKKILHIRIFPHFCHPLTDSAISPNGFLLTELRGNTSLYYSSALHHFVLSSRNVLHWNLSIERDREKSNLWKGVGGCSKSTSFSFYLAHCTTVRSPQSACLSLPTKQPINWLWNRFANIFPLKLRLRWNGNSSIDFSCSLQIMVESVNLF